MTQDWRSDLMRAPPRLFDIMIGPRGSRGYPLCDDGWCEIVERLCARLDAALGPSDTFAFDRIRQKFGILRADRSGEVSDETAEAVMDAVNLATARSVCTCETCGAEGRLFRHRGWLDTRCDDHATGEPVADRFGIVGVRAYRWRRGNTDGRYDRETDTLTEVSPRDFGREG